MSLRPFIKMHGLGNDFVVVDAREVLFVLDDGPARASAAHQVNNHELGKPWWKFLI